MRICLFSHFSENDNISNSVLYYLEKLNEIVDQVILLTNDRPISNLNIISSFFKKSKAFFYSYKSFLFIKYHKNLI